MLDKEGNTLGIQCHETLGADYLYTLGMPKFVCDLVGSHVDAKRYRCGKDKTYLKTLTTASISTLELQGGLMDSKEMADFEQNPLFHFALFVRDYDDGGKDLETKSTLNINDIKQIIFNAMGNINVFD